MAVTYFKRFRMEIDLGDWIAEPVLPEGFWWVAWFDDLVGVHAEVKFLCFQDELDAIVFPCLGDRNGCLRLMREIRRKEGFLPSATWLVRNRQEYCGTIQGVIAPDGVGSIQNVGVVPWHRKQSLGRALVVKALCGFRRSGATKARLEVTAENRAAIQLYHSIGFRKAKTLYKASDAE